MYNKFIGIGHVTKQPESRVTNTGIPVTTFTLAINRTYGEKEADFLPCVTFRKLAEIVAKHVNKGSLIQIDGKVQTRSYDAQDGSKRYVTEVVCDNVVFLDTKSDQNEKPRKENNYDISEKDSPF